MALRVVGDPKTIVLVLGPGGDVVGQVTLDLSVYGALNPILEGDLRPFLINCLDGMLLVVHLEGEHVAAYMQLRPDDIYRNSDLTEAFGLPSALINVRDYLAHMEELRREFLEKMGVRTIGSKKRKIPANSN